MTRRHPLVNLVPGAFLLAVLAGCATTLVAPADQPPAASSATGAVSRLAWGLSHKDVGIVRGLLTDDFVFLSAATDSAGNASRDSLGGRSWFLAALAALTDSSSSVSFVLGPNLLAFHDSRPGRDPKWHKQVRAPVHVMIHGSGTIGSYDLTGNALFFVTRGDSAAIPQQQRALGVKPDSTRWWLDRYEDETLAGGYLRFATQPARQITFALVLQYFYSLVAR